MGIFKIGMRVVCIAKGGARGWIGRDLLSTVHGPSYQEICLVTGLDSEGDLFLKGYDGLPGEGYDRFEFRPLKDGFAEEVLKEVFNEEFILNCIHKL